MRHFHLRNKHGFFLFLIFAKLFGKCSIALMYLSLGARNGLPIRSIFNPRQKIYAIDNLMRRLFVPILTAYTSAVALCHFDLCTNICAWWLICLHFACHPFDPVRLFHFLRYNSPPPSSRSLFCPWSFIQFPSLCLVRAPIFNIFFLLLLSLILLFMGISWNLYGSWLLEIPCCLSLTLPIHVKKKNKMTSGWRERAHLEEIPLLLVARLEVSDDNDDDNDSNRNEMCKK